MVRNKSRNPKGKPVGSAGGGGRRTREGLKKIKNVRERYHGEAEKSIKKLIAIRDDPNTPLGIVIDISKYLTDQMIGKSPQTMQMADSDGNNLAYSMQVNFAP